MRSLPLLLALLIAITGLTLGIVVMLQQPAAVSVAAAPRVTYRNGLPQGHVYAGVSTEPDDVNPFTSHSALTRRFVLGLTHEGLLDTDPATGELRGALAESWVLAPDAGSCTFQLRKGVRFSDGTPVTMADVLFGWELASAGHLTLGYVADAFGRVAAAEAIDDQTLRVTFREPYYAAVRAVGESWLVAKRSFFEGRVAAACRRLGQPEVAVTTSTFADLLAQVKRECGPGTGPFQLLSDDNGPTTWRRRQDLLLTENPHCWRREAMPGTWNLAGLRLLFREGPAVWNAAVKGEVDWAGAANVDDALQIPVIAANYRKIAYDYETLGVFGIAWNCTKPALADVRVRQALGQLVNGAAVVKEHRDRAVPAVAFAKPGSAGYPTDVEPLPFAPAEARRLLREAGFDPANGTPLRLSIVTPRDHGPMELATTLLVDAGNQAGVEITADTVSFEVYVAKKSAMEWDGLLMNLDFRPWGDPYDFVHSKGLDNAGQWQNAEADRLAAAARVEFDDDKRAALWRELHTLVYREQPFAFLLHPRSCVLFNKNIHEAKPGPRGLWPERWWVEPEFQRK